MGKFMVVSNSDSLAEHYDLCLKHDLGIEIDDFIFPELCDDENEMNSIINKYKKIQLPSVITMHGAFFDIYPASRDSFVRENSKKRMEQSMDIAEKLGVNAVIFHTNINPMIKADEYVNRNIELISECIAGLLKKYPDRNIYLENMFDDNPHILSEISKRLSVYKNYGVCFDYSHAILSSASIGEWVYELKDYIKHLHINDNDRKSDLHLAIGEGSIDWEEFKKYYFSFFSECTVLIETTSIENQKKSISFLKKLGLMPEKTGQNIACINKNSMSDIAENAENMLENIFDSMSGLMKAKDFGSTVNLLMELASSIVHANRASFWFNDRKQRTYWTLAAIGKNKISIPAGTGIVGRTIENEEIIVCNEPYDNPYFNPQVDKETGFVTKSILCMPLNNTSGEVIGALQVLNKESIFGDAGVFSEEDVKRLTIAGAFFAKTLESYLIHNEAYVDALTGLKNRYAFYEYYDLHILKKSQDSNMTIIMCDIDFFKKVNDTYGHNEGDEVLKTVAAILKNNMRANDVVVRWGGEEFIIILNECTEENGRNIAEKLRKIVEQHEFEMDDIRFKITMSFGVNRINKAVSLEENIKFADEKLYLAKNSGRNRVV